MMVVPPPLALHPSEVHSHESPVHSDPSEHVQVAWVVICLAEDAAWAGSGLNKEIPPKPITIIAIALIMNLFI